jgi:RNA polymerase sigma-70 factor (ECF subfamily)
MHGVSKASTASLAAGAPRTRLAPMTARDQQLAFERLLKPHMKRLYRLAFRLCGNRADAEDLFQEVLVKGCDRIETIAGLDDPGSWLARVMYNRFVDTARQRARQRLKTVSEGELPGVDLGNLGDTPSAEADASRLERMAELDRALATLSDAHRIVVLLHDTEGYKIEEIELLTGIKAGTIKSRLHRARARLREILCLDGTESG